VVTSASAAGVARETVHRWLKTAVVFRAELNRLKSDLQDAMERRLLALVRRAGDNPVGSRGEWQRGSLGRRFKGPRIPFRRETSDRANGSGYARERGQPSRSGTRARPHDELNTTARAGRSLASGPP
jgi:hypothetical protein